MRTKTLTETVRKSIILSKNDWERAEYLLKHGIFRDDNDVLNAAVRRGLPFLEKDHGIKHGIWMKESEEGVKS
jgi:hypothetical protein